jgi:acrylyl-CoA reductase (NADPH)
MPPTKVENLCLKLDGQEALIRLAEYILATSIKSTAPAGAVTCCGNAASPDLPINVFPFILRGITLIGIDSQNCPMTIRKMIWEKLAGKWKIQDIEKMVSEITLEQLDQRINMMMQRKHRGRTIIKLIS